MNNDFPIDLDILRKRQAIPVKIAELSYIDADEALKYMRIWGEKKMPITDLFDELITLLSEKNNQGVV